MFSFILAGSGLAQTSPRIRSPSRAPAVRGDANEYERPGRFEGVPSYHAYELKPPFPATLDPKQFPDAIHSERVRARRKNQAGVVPAALLLLLRPASGTQESARLFRQHARIGMRRLPEGSRSLLSTDAKGKDTCADSRGDHSRRLEIRGHESICGGNDRPLAFQKSCHANFNIRAGSHSFVFTVDAEVSFCPPIALHSCGIGKHS